MRGATFRAWIPSITGKLSFSQIGQIGNPPCEHSVYDRSIDGCRLHCIEFRTQKIDDSLFEWKSTLNSIFGVNTVFELDAVSPYRGAFQPFLRGTINCYVLRKYKRDVTPNNIAENSPVFSLKFCLHRSGNLCLFGLTLGEPAEELGSEHLERLTYYFIAQSYYFLKDAIHRHRHHNSGDDTFIEAVLGKLGWQSRIAFQLMKRVIRRPIERNLDSYQSALGILAYLKSYQVTRRLQIYTDEHMDAIADSLKAEYTRMSHDLTAKRWVYGLSLSLYSFLIARLLDWGAGITAEIWIGSFVWIMMLVYFCHKSMVFNWSKNWYFMELQKLLISMRTRGRLLSRILAVTCAAVAYLFQFAPEYLNVFNYF